MLLAILNTSLLDGGQRLRRYIVALVPHVLNDAHSFRPLRVVERAAARLEFSYQICVHLDAERELV